MSEPKIKKTYKVSDYEVMTDTGWQPVEAVHLTKKFEPWLISTKTFKMICADEHKVYNKTGEIIYVKDCIENKTKILTKYGVEEVIICSRLTNEKIDMYDLTVGSPEHRYYTNGILSSNTTIMTIFSLFEACFNEYRNIVVVANKLDTAKRILARIQLAYLYLPNWLKPGVQTWGKTEVVFDNGSSISVSTTTGSAARGNSISTLLIDEFSFIHPSMVDEFWDSVIPTISSSKRSKIFIVSTFNGTGNKFYEIYKKAEDNKFGEDELGFKAEKIMWNEVPGRGEKWERTQRSLIGDKAFEQEFGCIPHEQNDSVVDRALLAEMRKYSFAPILEYEDKKYKIWKEPQENRLYGVGVDVSEGIGNASSVVQILDFTDLSRIEQVATYSNDKIHPSVFGELLYRICQHWGNPPILIERNNCGAEVLTTLAKNFHYQNIVSYIPKNENNSKSNNYEERLGVYCSTATKNHAVMNMRYWMNALKAVKLNDLKTIRELETFVQQPNGTWRHDSGVGMFDDHVMSLVWCLFMLEKQVVERYYEIAELDINGYPKRLNSYNNIIEPEYNKGDYLFNRVYNTNESILPMAMGWPVSERNEEFDFLVKQGWRPVRPNDNNY